MRAALHEMAADVPEARDGGTQAQLGAGAGGGPEERERRSQVVVVAGEGVQRAGFADARLEPLGKGQEVLGVAAARRRRARLQRPVARARTRAPSRAWRSAARRRLRISCAHQAVVDEGGKRPQAGAADRLGGIQRAAAGEHGQPGEQRPLARLEQLVAPVDRRAQRVLAGGRVARAGREQVKAVLEPREHRRRVEQLGARGGQLEGEREPVEGPADAGDRAGVGIGQREVGCGRRARGPRTASTASLNARVSTVGSGRAAGSVSGGTAYSCSPDRRSAARLVTSALTPAPPQAGG